jgi:hypothetical protein
MVYDCRKMHKFSSSRFVYRPTSVGRCDSALFLDESDQWGGAYSQWEDIYLDHDRYYAEIVRKRRGDNSLLSRGDECGFATDSFIGKNHCTRENLCQYEWGDWRNGVGSRGYDIVSLCHSMSKVRQFDTTRRATWRRRF